MTASRHAQRAARRLFQDCVIASVVDEDRARRVTVGIIESRRRIGAAILAHFHRLVRLDHERHTVTVESAVPLSDDLRGRIQSALARRYGPGLSSSFSDDPSLIGGVRITVGSDRYDGTVRARLDALEARL